MNDRITPEVVNASDCDAYMLVVIHMFCDLIVPHDNITGNLTVEEKQDHYGIIMLHIPFFIGYICISGISFVSSKGFVTSFLIRNSLQSSTSICFTFFHIFKSFGSHRSHPFPISFPFVYSCRHC